MAQPDDDNRWRIKKEVSLGDLVAIAVAIGAVAIAYMRLDARVLVIEATTASNAIAIHTLVVGLREDIRYLTNKVDRVIENRNGKP